MGKQRRTHEKRRELKHDPSAFSLRLTYYMNGLIEAKKVGAKLVKYDGRTECEQEPLIKTGVQEIRRMLSELTDMWTKFAEEHEL